MGRPFLSQDMSQIRYLSSPTVTADGEAAAWVVTTGDEESGRFFSQIMVLEGQGEPVPLPAPEGSSQTQPSFLSRDVLAYLSDEGGRRQIHLYHLRGGGEAAAHHDPPRRRPVPRIRRGSRHCL